MAEDPGATTLWLKRAVMALLAPFLFFGAVEAALQITGYGGPKTFFKTVEVEGKNVAVENAHFGRRLFRPYVARAPGWNLVPEPRQGVARVAVIGESAALGYPLQKIGLANMLQGVLETEYPGKHFDLINACMTAVNSHVLESVVPEVSALKPDVAVVYMGNNEVVGPYGPGTPFLSWPGAPAIASLDKKLRQTRTFDLLHDSISWVLQTPTEKWQGFGMFAGMNVSADDPLLADVYSAFEKNLSTMVDTLLAAGSKVVLCTVAVNLADWGPSGISPLPEQSEAAALLRRGMENLQAGRADDAISAFAEADKMAPRRAETQFWLGRAFYTSGDLGGARSAFEKARDLDAHRFRADSRINEIIRRVAARHAGAGVVLVDADRLLAPGGVTTKEQFIEHVHFTFDGVLSLAVLVADGISSLFPEWKRSQKVTLADSPQLRTRLFFTPFDELSLAKHAIGVGDTEIFRSRPAASETKQHFARIADGIKASDRLNLAQLRMAYDAAVALAPDDPRRDDSCAFYLWQLGQYGPASALAQSVLNRKPNYHEALFMSGEIALKRGDLDTAEKFLHRVIDVSDGISEAWKGLGDVASRRGDIGRAKSLYSKAWHMDPAQSGAALALADLHLRESNTASARETLVEALQTNPDSAELLLALARIHVIASDLEAAHESLLRALQLSPDLDVRGHLAFLAKHVTDRELKRAFEACEEHAEGEPNILNNFAWLLSTSPDAEVRDPAKGLRLAQRAVELSSGRPRAFFHGTLAAAEAAGGNFDAALVALGRARALPISNPARWSRLADRMEASFARGEAFVEHD